MNFFSALSILIGLFIVNYVVDAVDFVGEISIIFSGMFLQAAVFLIFAYVK